MGGAELCRSSVSKEDVGGYYGRRCVDEGGRFLGK